MVDQDAYDGLMAAIGRESVDAPAPGGALAHFAGRTQDGWRVIDVWNSEEDANAFYSSDAFKAVSEGAPSMTTTPWRLHRTEVYETARTTS